MAYQRPTTSWGFPAICRELAVTKDHDKTDEAKETEKTKAASPKASRRGKAMETLPTMTQRAKASSRKARTAKAKEMWGERALEQRMPDEHLEVLPRPQLLHRRQW